MLIECDKTKFGITFLTQQCIMVQIQIGFFFTKSRTTTAVMQIKWTLNLELAGMNMTQNTMIEKPGIPQSTNFIKEIIFKKTKHFLN